jgi:hypothetical protein
VTAASQELKNDNPRKIRDYNCFKRSRDGRRSGLNTETMHRCQYVFLLPPLQLFSSPVIDQETSVLFKSVYALCSAGHGVGISCVNCLP